MATQRQLNQWIKQFQDAGQLTITKRIVPTNPNADYDPTLRGFFRYHIKYRTLEMYIYLQDGTKSLIDCKLPHADWTIVNGKQLTILCKVHNGVIVPHDYPMGYIVTLLEMVIN